MMRYRRNRVTTLEGQQSQGGSSAGGGVPGQQVASQQTGLPSQGIGYGVGSGPAGAPWAMYQTGGSKPIAQVMRSKSIFFS